MKNGLQCMKYLLIFFSGLLQMLELIASVVSPISHCVRTLSQICIACIGCVSRNKLEHVRIFASPLRPSLRPLRPVCHLSPPYVFHCAKIDSVQTQLTQGKKRIVGARLKYFLLWLIFLNCLYLFFVARQQILQDN